MLLKKEKCHLTNPNNKLFSNVLILLSIINWSLYKVSEVHGWQWDKVESAMFESINSNIYCRYSLQKENLTGTLGK